MSHAIMLAALLPGIFLAGSAGAQEFTVSTISVTGNSAMSAAQIEEAGSVKPGSRWGGDEADFVKAAIQSLYRGSGYMNADVGLTELRTGASVQLLIDVREGGRYSFGATDFRGLEKLRANTVRRELAYRMGDPYGQDKLVASQSRLFATDWFETIRTRISSSPASTVIDVSMDVKEKPLKWITGGAGYGSEEKERFSLGYTQSNFMRRGYKLDLNAQWSRIWIEYKADFLDRHFLDGLIEMRDSSAWRLEHRSGYEQESMRNTLGFGRKLSKYLSGAVQHRLQRTLIYNIDTSLAAITPPLSLLSAAGLALNYDTTDDFFYPSRGIRSEFTAERSGGVWGGDINLYKAATRTNFYQRLLPSVTLLLSARGAFVHNTGPTREVPIYERLFTGGANSIRGYNEREVGPSDLNGNPTGGKVLLGANTELRLPLYGKLRAALFADGGQVSGSLPGSAPRRWKYGAGGGLRYRTPVGPLRADLGYKLNPPEGADRWRVHISMGEAF